MRDEEYKVLSLCPHLSARLSPKMIMLALQDPQSVHFPLCYQYKPKFGIHPSPVIILSITVKPVLIPQRHIVPHQYSKNGRPLRHPVSSCFWGATLALAQTTCMSGKAAENSADARFPRRQ